MADSSLRPMETAPVALAQLSGLVPGVELAPGADGATTVAGISLDSRTIRPGDLYLARGGEHSHGIEFVAEALAAGAVAVLTDRPSSAMSLLADVPVLIAVDPRAIAGRVAAIVYGEPATKLRLFGVTGTNGKTTTTWFLDSVLRAAGMVTGIIGTVATIIAGEQVTSIRTTPESTDLQALLALMVERGVTAVSMEVSSHALALGRVAGCFFTCSGFTNLTQDHLDFHGDMESYFQAKASLFDPSLTGVGVVTIDDEHGRRLAQSADVPISTLAADAVADWSWSSTPDGFRLSGTDRELEVRVRLPGRFNRANAALAVAMAATVLDVSDEIIASGVAGLAAVPGRMQQVEAGQPFTVIVDYAHTPDAVALLVEEARAIAVSNGGGVCILLGCGGDRDKAKRPLMGEAAAMADRLVITDDNPRSEDPAEIRMAMAAGASGHAATVTEIGDRRAAIRSAIGSARAGDVVIIAGKGHETGQQIGDLVHPFDDVTVARQELLAAGWDSRVGVRG